MNLLQRQEGHHQVENGRYWAFGYYLRDLDNEQKRSRRECLDWYGFVAQWSVLLIFALFQISFLGAWLINSGLRHDPPKSPSLNRRTNGRLRWLSAVQVFMRRWIWWTRQDVFSSRQWGSRGEWIGAGLWSAWLLYLCITHTEHDYLHLTKRFGQVGASQMPVLYLLAMRAPCSPIQWLTRLSHEQLKASHQILGRIILALFFLHVLFYFNFFVISGVLAKRTKDWDVIWGIVGIALFTALSTTAIGFVRRRNYSVFYKTHIAIATFIGIPLYLHVSHIRILVYEIVLVHGLHLILRALYYRIYTGTIELVPGTNLVQIRIPLPAASSTLCWKPGQHVYLSTPAKKGRLSFYDQWLMVNKTNPFTVVSLPEKDEEVVLVARTLNGNTRHLAELARGLAQEENGIEMLPAISGDIPVLLIGLEGPYGASARLPDLSDYSQVLLIAGGVGATFIMPIYRSIATLHDPVPGQRRVRFVWAVQRLADTDWAFPVVTSPVGGTEASAGVEVNEEGAFHGSSMVEIYLTRAISPEEQMDGEDGEEEHERLLNTKEQVERGRRGTVVKRGRPKMGEVVNESLRRGGRTAVVCCGPKRLTRDAKANVRHWVDQGHDVFWHDETFGW